MMDDAMISVSGRTRIVVLSPITGCLVAVHSSHGESLFPPNNYERQSYAPDLRRNTKFCLIAKVSKSLPHATSL